MIPYLDSPTEALLNIGNASIFPFTLLVLIGVGLGLHLANTRRNDVGLPPRLLMLSWVVVILCGFLGSYYVWLFVYHADLLLGTPCDGRHCPDLHVCRSSGRCSDGDPSLLVTVWRGMTSFGGLLGGLLGFALLFAAAQFSRGRQALGIDRPVPLAFLQLLDLAAYAFIAGWIFGRTGCFFAHDHVGIATDFFLAVNYPDGWRQGVPPVEHIGNPGFTPRLNMGMFEVPWAFAMLIFLDQFARRRSGLRPGFFIAISIFTYAPFRVFLDFFRATDVRGADPRYFTDLFLPGATPSQIGSLILLLVGLCIWYVGGRLQRRYGYDAQYRPEQKPNPGEEATRAAGEHPADQDDGPDI